MRAVTPQTVIDRIDVSAFTIPTDEPESDGTFEWSATTLVLCEAVGGDERGLGFTYGDRATAQLIRGVLAGVVQGRDVMAVPALWEEMIHATRNLGQPGMVAMAIAAVDAALWDLKARLLDLPLAKLLGPARSGVPVYGSGGFTSYSLDRLVGQLEDWVEGGIPRVKMKVGRDPGADHERVRAAREAVGRDAHLFVDANGAYDRKQALAMAERFADHGVSWFEEPVSSDDLEGLRLLRNRVPACMEVAAGEYGYDLAYFRRMLEHGAVDVLQADVTRCAGITGFMRVATLCDARQLPLSAHTAPAMHLHPGAAAPRLRHLEYFHDHVRIEQLLFDGVVTPREGVLYPDMTRPGNGLELKRTDAERYAA